MVTGAVYKPTAQNRDVPAPSTSRPAVRTTRRSRPVGRRVRRVLFPLREQTFGKAAHPGRVSTAPSSRDYTPTNVISESVGRTGSRERGYHTTGVNRQKRAKRYHRFALSPDETGRNALWGTDSGIEDTGGCRKRFPFGNDIPPVTGGLPASVRMPTGSGPRWRSCFGNGVAPDLPRPVWSSNRSERTVAGADAPRVRSRWPAEFDRERAGPAGKTRPARRPVRGGTVR